MPGPNLIVRYLVEVLASVQFDDQAGVDAAEVGDGRIDRNLAADLKPSSCRFLNARQSLSVGLFDAVSPSARNDDGRLSH